MTEPLTRDMMLDLFEYKDGHLYKKKASRGSKKGAKLGTFDHYGYVTINIKGKNYKAHRLIFLYYYGYLPEFIDHVDGNRANNKIENLREATKSQNSTNAKRRKDNTSTIKNISWHTRSKIWVVRVQTNGIRKQINCGIDLEFAELVAIEARNKYHKEYLNHG